MNNIRNSSFLKVICYILIPILVAIFVFSIFHLSFLDKYGDSREYTQSEFFGDNYLSFVTSQLTKCNNVNDIYNNDFVKVKDDMENSYYYSDAQNNQEVYTSMPIYVEYIIINNKTKQMFTNIKSQDYQKIMDEIKNNNIYWIVTNGNIDTNIECINQENYKYNFEHNYKNSNDGNDKLGDYDIYTYYDSNLIDKNTILGMSQTIYQYMLENKIAPFYAFFITTVLLSLIAIYLFWSIGHKKGENKINLNTIDNIPYEILCAGCFCAIMILLVGLANMFRTVNYITLLSIIICYFICYAICRHYRCNNYKKDKG